MQKEKGIRKKPANSKGSLLLSFAFLLLPLFAAAGIQEMHPPTPHRHPEAQKVKNPIPRDESSITEGRKTYLRHCASCHGPSGKGDGGMALAGGTPSNLTDETWDHGSSDGEIFVVIRDGTSADMESYKDKLTEKQIWQLVNYIRSLSPKK
ncbi:MAG: cytochrome c [Acidobacteriota bacterium]